jgi:ketosteroid isomerase-like protein
MTRIAFAIGLVVLVFGVAILAQTQTESVEQELIKLKNQWTDAVVKLDFASLERVLADDFTWTGTDGNVVTKAQLVASLTSGEGGAVVSAVIDEIKVRIYGDAAVVLGRSTEKSRYRQV